MLALGLLLVALVIVALVHWSSSRGVALPEDGAPGPVTRHEADGESIFQAGSRLVASLPPLMGQSPLEDAKGPGRVLVQLNWEDNGAPAVSVGVRLLPAGSQSQLGLRRALSGPDGTAEFGALETGEFVIVTEVGARTSTHVAAGSDTVVELLLKRGVKVVGVVLDKARNPVPNAVIWMSDRVTFTDESARRVAVEFDAAPSWRAPFHDKREMVRIANGKTTPALPFLRDLRGLDVGLTDANGEFTLESISPWRYIGARAAGFAPSSILPITELPGGAERIEFVLDGSGSGMDGIVLDAEGRRVAGALVEVGNDREGLWVHVPGKGTVAGARPVATRTDGDGGFSVVGLPAGRLFARAWAPGHAPYLSIVELEPGEVRFHRIELRRGMNVVGRVIDAEGKPVARAQVAPFHHGGGFGVSGTLTDESGRFELQGLGVANAREGAQLQVVADGGRFGRACADVPFTPESTHEVELRLSRGHVLRGTLRDADGAPLDGWTIQFAVRGGVNYLSDVTDGETPSMLLDSAMARTGTDGGFEFANCMPGPARLDVRRCEVWTPWTEASFECDLPTESVVSLTVDPRKSPSSTLIAQLAPDETIPKGRFARLHWRGGPDGAPQPMRGRREWHWTRYFDSSGTLSVPLLPAGDYELEIFRDGVALARREFSLGFFDVLDLGVITQQ